MPMAPCAKLTTPDPRYTRTRHTPAMAYRAPAPTPRMANRKTSLMVPPPPGCSLRPSFAQSADGKNAPSRIEQTLFRTVARAGSDQLTEEWSSPGHSTVTATGSSKARLADNPVLRDPRAGGSAQHASPMETPVE